ncbi:MAG: hypothetical protein JXR03_06480 [Cyclobacteriaceae bacterium]
MKKLLTIALCVVAIYGCDNSKETSSSESYESQKTQIKERAIASAKVLSMFPMSTATLLDEETGYYSNVRNELIQSSSDNNIASIIARVEENYKKGSDIQLSKPLLNRRANIIANIEGALAGFYNQVVDVNFRKLDDDDIVSVDSVYAYFEHFKTSLKEDFDLEESSIDTDDELTETEKLALISANTLMQESIDQIVDSLVEDYINDEGIENGRIFGRFKRWLKRTANVVATVATRAYTRGIQGGVLGFLATGNPLGFQIGAITGYVLGVGEGLECYGSNTCVTCVFCQPNPNKPCTKVAGC